MYNPTPWHGLAMIWLSMMLGQSGRSHDMGAGQQAKEGASGVPAEGLAITQERMRMATPGEDHNPLEQCGVRENDALRLRSP